MSGACVISFCRLTFSSLPLVRIWTLNTRYCWFAECSIIKHIFYSENCKQTSLFYFLLRLHSSLHPPNLCLLWPFWMYFCTLVMMILLLAGCQSSIILCHPPSRFYLRSEKNCSVLFSSFLVIKHVTSKAYSSTRARVHDTTIIKFQ